MIPHLIFSPGPGQTIPIANGKGAAATPDYKTLYFELFRANEQAIRLLTAAQQKAEAQVMEEGKAPLYLEKPLRHCLRNAASPNEGRQADAAVGLGSPARGAGGRKPD